MAKARGSEISPAPKIQVDRMKIFDKSCYEALSKTPPRQQELIGITERMRVVNTLKLKPLYNPRKMSEAQEMRASIGLGSYDINNTSRMKRASNDGTEDVKLTEGDEPSSAYMARENFSFKKQPFLNY